MRVTIFKIIRKLNNKILSISTSNSSFIAGSLQRHDINESTTEIGGPSAITVETKELFTQLLNESRAEYLMLMKLNTNRWITL